VAIADKFIYWLTDCLTAIVREKTAVISHDMLGMLAVGAHCWVHYNGNLYIGSRGPFWRSSRQAGRPVGDRSVGRSISTAIIVDHTGWNCILWPSMPAAIGLLLPYAPSDVARRLEHCLGQIDACERGASPFCESILYEGDMRDSSPDQCKYVKFGVGQFDWRSDRIWTRYVVRSGASIVFTLTSFYLEYEYSDGRSQIKVHTDKRTPADGAQWSPIEVLTGVDVA